MACWVMCDVMDGVVLCCIIVGLAYPIRFGCDDVVVMTTADGGRPAPKGG